MESLLGILQTYGVGGVLLVALVYIILKGRFTFQYPGDKKENLKNKNTP